MQGTTTEFNNIWSAGETESILKRTSELYVTKSRKQKLDNGNGLSKKLMREKEEETDKSSDEEEITYTECFKIIFNSF